MRAARLVEVTRTYGEREAAVSAPAGVSRDFAPGAPTACTICQANCPAASSSGSLCAGP